MDHSSAYLKLIAATIFSVFAASIPTSRCKGEDGPFEECSRLLNCGSSFSNLSYPFWGGDRPQICGHWGFELDCVNDTFPVIHIGDLGFRILKINQSTDTDVYKMRIARLDMWDGPCSSNVLFVNTSLNYPLFDYVQSGPTRVYNLTLLYGCAEPPFYEGKSFVCDGGDTIYFANESSVEGLKAVNLTTCKNIVRVAVSDGESSGGNSAIGSLGLEQLMKQGFEVEYDSNIKSDCRNCEMNLHGVCGSDNTTTFPKFNCFCRGQTGCSMNLDPQAELRNIIVGSATGAIVILVIICILICCYRKTKSCIRSTRIWERMRKKNGDLEAVIRGDGHLPVKRYKFKEVKKMTKSFKHKLGQGGYGDVFRGKLLDDGRLVAIKVLEASKGNGEEFINEVASISRTSHVNIVTLLGFCLEGKKRALVYEFMPNGSLEKFIYKDSNASPTNSHLDWDKLLQIASGIARGLEYLHRGCITRILHFDIKPHNILLDEEFCPKISDFGLAKLCSNKESVVSLMDARGTVGYIAPEVVSRNFGGVSSKADVYSYGMMILEMVGGRKNMKIGVKNPSQVYFPDWIYKHVELGSKLELSGNMSSAENEIARKMVLVGLWCIQTNPSDRPTMSKVIEMLEGSLQALQIPPKPSMFSSRSPERLPAEVLAESLSSFGT